MIYDALCMSDMVHGKCVGDYGNDYWVQGLTVGLIILQASPGPDEKSSWKSAILIEFYVLASSSSPFCSTAMAQLFFGGCLTGGCAFVSLF